MKMITPRLFWVFLFVVLGWDAAGAEVANRVVAFVNDDVVTLFELNRKIRELSGNNPEDLRAHDKARFEDVQRSVLDLLVEEKITLAKVKELGITISDKEIDAAVERVKQSNRWTDEDLLYNLRREGTTLEDFRDGLRRSIQRNRLINYEVKSRIIIREENLREYYESHKDSFSSVGRVHLAGIVLMFRDSEDRDDRAATLRKAGDILERLRGGEPFAELAGRFSKGPGAREGGDLGVFSWSELDSQIREAIEDFRPGDVSEPILRPAGVQILKVLDRSEGEMKPFEEVREAIYDILYEQEMESRYEKWIEDLKQKAYVKTVL
jgi:peptidyl-prolyl cis-trans isomerase SurA